MDNGNMRLKLPHLIVKSYLERTAMLRFPFPRPTVSNVHKSARNRSVPIVDLRPDAAPGLRG
jgi:hypothetical protein